MRLATHMTGSDVASSASSAPAAAAASLFRARPRLSTVPLGGGRVCVVVDDALSDPQAFVAWARRQALRPPTFPYPGLVGAVGLPLVERVAEFFAQHARTPLGARRTIDATARLSIVCTPPEQLDPRQWQCHRDRVVQDDSAVMVAASVLYLFDDPRLGGTSFYVPRQSAAETDRLQADSQLLDAGAFGAKYGLRAGYLDGSNAYFERVAQVPAAFNRMIFYDGGQFHSADVGDPSLLDADPARGRLTLNGFFTCRRAAR